eukprot:121827-Prymnesium_polylepis.1
MIIAGQQDSTYHKNEIYNRSDELKITLPPPLTVHHAGNCTTTPTMHIEVPLHIEGTSGDAAAELIVHGNVTAEAVFDKGGRDLVGELDLLAARRDPGRACSNLGADTTACAYKRGPTRGIISHSSEY